MFLIHRLSGDLSSSSESALEVRHRRVSTQIFETRKITPFFSRRLTQHFVAVKRPPSACTCQKNAESFLFRYENLLLPLIRELQSADFNSWILAGKCEFESFKRPLEKNLALLPRLKRDRRGDGKNPAWPCAKMPLALSYQRFVSSHPMKTS